MSSTNKTSNLELSQFIGTDSPKWLTDYNSDMQKIDTGVNTVQSQANATDIVVSGHTSSIATINESISDQGSAISTLRTDVTAAQGSINTINSLIGNGEPTTTDKTIIGAINELADDIVNSQKDIIIISASYGSTPSTDYNCLTLLSNMLSGIYGNIYTSTHGGDSFHDGSYLTQLQSVTVADANAVKDIVIVGIGNDSSSSWADVSSGMVSFYTYAHAAYPNAKISIAPVSTRTTGSAATSLYNLYINMINNIATTKISVFTQIFHVLAYDYTQIGSDGMHPTADGAATIARAIFNVLCNGSYEYTNKITLNNLSDFEFIDTNLTVSAAFYNLVYSNKSIKVRYGLNFTPTADETLTSIWGSGIALSKDSHLKGINSPDSKEISCVLSDTTSGDVIPASISLYNSTANGYYWELVSRTGSSVNLQAGHVYSFRTNGSFVFDVM